MSDRFVHDPIHGLISFDQLTWSIVDTPHFQRLRDIKQMDVSSFIYPGACHSRFDHSLGVGYLSEQMIGAIRERQPELRITESEIQAVRLAGLCHDLGHGPFSHLFDNMFIPAVRPGTQWSHEAASQMLIDRIVDYCHLDLPAEQVGLVKQLIQGDVSPGYSDRKFLFEIVANKRNSFDVDKFDYINRDSYYIGFKDRYNFERVIHQARVIGDTICYPAKDVFNVWELFQKRYSLFKRVYTHPTADAIQFMIVDALIAADNVLKISDSIDDMDSYVTFTDCIVGEIYRSTDPRLKDAKAIIDRIKRRNLYTLAFESLLRSSALDETTIARQLRQQSSVDFCVLIVRINYGMKHKNPIEHMSFFEKSNLAGDAFQVHPDFLPLKFEERVVRVYTKTAPPAGFAELCGRVISSIDIY